MASAAPVAPSESEALLASMRRGTSLRSSVRLKKGLRYEYNSMSGFLSLSQASGAGIAIDGGSASVAVRNLGQTRTRGGGSRGQRPGRPSILPPGFMVHSILESVSW